METKLEKKFGLFTAICMVVGIVIGSGVFFKAQTVLQKTEGNMPLGILAWIIGGTIMIICILAFAAMAQRYRTELQGVRQDLLEILYQNDTEPFTCGGDTVDPRRQQVLASKTAAYSTPEGVMMVESRRPGYARGERILRREQVYAIQILPTWMKEELSDGQHEPPSPM